MNRTLLALGSIAALSCGGTTDVGDHVIPPIPIADLVGTLDGSLLTIPCSDESLLSDCRCEGLRLNGGDPITCVGDYLSATVDYPIRGETGKTYDITLHFYGIVEPYAYLGSSLRREANLSPASREGGLPHPWASVAPGDNYRDALSIFNSYELHVYDAANVLQAVYLLNSDSDTGTYTLLLNYEKTLTVFGGGKLQLVLDDTNCRQVKNCGIDKGLPCAPRARTVDISSAVPQPAVGALLQPTLGKNPEYPGQWLLLDVTAVSKRER